MTSTLNVKLIGYVPIPAIVVQIDMIVLMSLVHTEETVHQSTAYIFLFHWAWRVAGAFRIPTMMLSLPPLLLTDLNL